MGWWSLAESWLREAEGLPHGSVETALVRFAAAHDRKPISVRKAIAAYRFIKSSLGSAEVESQLAALPLEAVETLRRLSRYEQFDLSDLIAKVVAGSLRGEALEAEEMRIRKEARATSAMSDDSHLFRLRARPFRTVVQKKLVMLFPPPSTYVSAQGLARNSVLACDALVRGPAGYSGVKILATRSGGDRTAWPREILHQGLAKSRIYQELFYVCQHHEDAETISRVFAGVPPCGVGVVRLSSDATFDVVREARRDAAPDLASRFQDILADAFEDGKKRS